MALKLLTGVGMVGIVTLLSACSQPDGQQGSSGQGASVADTAISLDKGRELYSKNCAGCHGLMMNGTMQGPPLNHKIYEPSHHGDQAFYRAVKEGTRAHHWNFGDMQPLPQVTTEDVTQIIAYVRDRQQKSGIR